MHTKFFMGTLKGTSHGRHRCRWENNININTIEIDYEDVDWVHLAQDKFRWLAQENTVTKLFVP